MANTYVNKVVSNGVTEIDLTIDDVAAADVLSGKKFHLPSGEPKTGTCTYDADTKDATAEAADLLVGETAYVNGSKVTGTMPNKGAVVGNIDTVDGKFTIAAGCHDGSGYAQIKAEEQAKIIPGNILKNITILGVTGTVEPSSEIQIEPAKSVTPSFTAQTILPSTGYDAMAEIDVAVIPVTRTDNAQGGVTLTIG